MGLERGGAGKREYLGFLASMVKRCGDMSAAGGPSMSPSERVERVGGTCKSDSGSYKGQMHVEQFANVGGAGGRR